MAKPQQAASKPQRLPSSVWPFVPLPYPFQSHTDEPARDGADVAPRITGMGIVDIDAPAP
jgi:hypothetical protein